MAYGPITSWQTDRETMETLKDFIFLGSKFTRDGDCNHEIKIHLLLGRKAMTNLNGILKSTDTTFLAKVCLVKGVVSPVVINGSERWTIQTAEQWKIDAFKLSYWRKLLRISWTAKTSNQSILKETGPKYSLEGLMLKLNSDTLATWYKKTDSL